MGDRRSEIGLRKELSMSAFQLFAAERADNSSAPWPAIPHFRFLLSAFPYSTFPAKADARLLSLGIIRSSFCSGLPTGPGLGPQTVDVARVGDTSGDAEN
jgi:hypothetical protein